MSYDDPAQTKSEKEKALFQEEGEILALRNLMRTEDGRRYLFKKLKDGNIFRDSFTGNSETFLNEGMRRSALRLQGDMIDANMEDYFQMFRENWPKDRRDKFKLKTKKQKKG